MNFKLWPFVFVCSLLPKCGVKFLEITSWKISLRTHLANWSVTSYSPRHVAKHLFLKCFQRPWQQFIWRKNINQYISMNVGFCSCFNLCVGVGVSFWPVIRTERNKREDRRCWQYFEQSVMQHSWEACRILCREWRLNPQSQSVLADTHASRAYKEKHAEYKISRWDLWRNWQNIGHGKKEELNHLTAKHQNVQTQILKLLENIYHPRMMIHNILKEYWMMAFEFC